MKQMITVDELNKLSDEHRERLREWWKPEYGDLYAYTDGEGRLSDSLWDVIANASDFNTLPDVCYPILSIGQMIAFIQDKKPLLKGISKNRFNQWFVNIENGMLGYKDELCDALFETVKQLLKG